MKDAASGATPETKHATLSTPCAACKLLRRRCTEECVFAPYFPPEEPQKFIFVHRVFGASNVNKMLQELPIHQRENAVIGMVYEAHARIKDPVHGCTRAILSMQQKIAQLRMQLSLAREEIINSRTQRDRALFSNLVNPASTRTTFCKTPASSSEACQQLRPFFLHANDSGDFCL